MLCGYIPHVTTILEKKVSTKNKFETTVQEKHQGAHAHHKRGDVASFPFQQGKQPIHGTRHGVALS